MGKTTISVNSNGAIHESELIINPDGSIYHLHVKPDEIADIIILVGDPNRVNLVSRHFDTIQHKTQYREFITHTGFLNNQRLSVVSTGIGTDNIDIAMNELDALHNIDFKTRMIKEEITSLNIFRLGTSGSVQEEIDTDTIVVSEIGIGMDGLLNFYEHGNSIQETVYLETFTGYMKPYFNYAKPYIASASETLLRKFETIFEKGTTITANGFYAPQGRQLRMKAERPDFIQVINQFRHKHFRITNLEMETAAIYSFGKILGHQCLSINAIVANRVHQTFSRNPSLIIDKMIERSLEIIAK